jgi:hypothetical protein
VDRSAGGLCFVEFRLAIIEMVKGVSGEGVGVEEVGEALGYMRGWIDNR